MAEWHARGDARFTTHGSYTTVYMGEIVSFRADDDEVALIERTRRQLGLQTRAEAIRHLLRAAAEARPKFSATRLAKFRLPASMRTGRTWSSAEIDTALYDDPQRRP